MGIDASHHRVETCVRGSETSVHPCKEIVEPFIYVVEPNIHPRRESIDPVPEIEQTCEREGRNNTDRAPRRCHSSMIDLGHDLRERSRLNRAVSRGYTTRAMKSSSCRRL